MSEPVILTGEFRAAPEGHTTIVYPKGAEVSGIVADLAIKAGLASRPAKTKAPQIKKPASPKEAK